MVAVPLVRAISALPKNAIKSKDFHVDYSDGFFMVTRSSIKLLFRFVVLSLLSAACQSTSEFRAVLPLYTSSSLPDTVSISRVIVSEFATTTPCFAITRPNCSSLVRSVHFTEIKMAQETLHFLSPLYPFGLFQCGNKYFLEATDENSMYWQFMGKNKKDTCPDSDVLGYCPHWHPIALRSINELQTFEKKLRDCTHHDFGGKSSGKQRTRYATRLTLGTPKVRLLDPAALEAIISKEKIDELLQKAQSCYRAVSDRSPHASFRCQGKIGLANDYVYEASHTCSVLSGNQEPSIAMLCNEIQKYLQNQHREHQQGRQRVRSWYKSTLNRIKSEGPITYTLEFVR